MTNFEFIENKLKSDYPNHFEDIIRGLQMPKKVTFRVNTTKTTVDEVLKLLYQVGLSVKEVEWNKEAFILNQGDEKVLRALDIYEKGHIYLQNLSSMIPPIILNPGKGDILDMAAAPGGKTTQMVAMNPLANITACEQNPIRAEKLKYNLEKQGATKVTVLIKDARMLDNYFRFDQILLDAPCSGIGTLDLNHESNYKHFTEQLIKKSIETQKALMLKAIQLLKSKQTMVYSTCSLLKSENEAIIEFALNTKKVEVIPINLDIEGKLPSTIPGVLTVMPNDLYEGFFICLLRKK